ncbi:MAG: hypothetical protein IJ802_04620 [Kiritimatiellae bacterium]|nr:hypothetical protein [Kiritimatiellia bacterium]
MGNKTLAAFAAAAAAGSLAMFALASGDDSGAKAVTNKTSETSVVTNENGSVSHTFTETSVTTNGNMVTERRRETCTSTDAAGAVLQTVTSEYASSWSIGGVPDADAADADDGEDKSTYGEAAGPLDTFLGLRFGDVFEVPEDATPVREDGLLRLPFTPGERLDGFDDYFVYFTPATHKIARVCACARLTPDPAANSRYHYLITAIERRYNVVPRLLSWYLPHYAFDVAQGKRITVRLSGASIDYQTIVSASDAAMLQLARRENEERRQEERKERIRRHNDKIEAAARALGQ